LSDRNQHIRQKRSTEYDKKQIEINRAAKIGIWDAQQIVSPERQTANRRNMTGKKVVGVFMGLSGALMLILNGAGTVSEGLSGGRVMANTKKP